MAHVGCDLCLGKANSRCKFGSDSLVPWAPASPFLSLNPHISWETGGANPGFNQASSYGRLGIRLLIKLFFFGSWLLSFMLRC